MSGLVLEDVWKSFGGVAAVKGLTFGIPRQRITGLIGPNGAGKTTSFHVITGVLKPDKGSVALDGRELTGMSPSAIVHHGIARSFQDVRLFGRMSAVDNVLVAQPRTTGYVGQLLMPARRSGLDVAAARELLDRVGLLAEADRIAVSLSYAQQKALAIARLLATRARYLLLDEPTSGLDESSVRSMTAILKEIAASGVGICVVEHNMDLIADLCDEVVFMAEGRCLATGHPREIMQRQDLAEIFFGSAQ